MKFSGIHTPILTPFNEDGSIDYRTLEQLIDFQIANGVSGILSGGSTGEFYALDEGERYDVNLFVMDYVAGRAILTAGTNATTTKDVIKYSKHADKLGYDTIMLAPPYYSLLSQHELLKHFLSVLNNINLPLILYNFPARVGVEIGYDVLDILADHPQVLGIKESSGDITRMHDIINRYEGRLQLICGADDQAFEYFAWGVEAWICGAANPVPAENAAVIDLALSGKFNQARHSMQKLMPFVKSLEGGKYIQKTKYAMELVGLPCGSARAPLLSLTEEESSELKTIVNQLIE